MALDKNTILGLAEHLETAELQAHDVTKITDEHPDMDWADAYAIQDEIRRRKEARGCKTVGLKCGLTSFAKMKQMGVDVPVFGFVSDYMSRPEGAAIAVKELIHPKVEAEICVVTKAPLRGPGCHVGAVMAAIDFVLPGVEVIDSRYRDFKFDLKSVIADNTSASRFVVGGPAAQRLGRGPAHPGRGDGEERKDRRHGRGCRGAGPPGRGGGGPGQSPGCARAGDPGRQFHHDWRGDRGHRGAGRRPHRGALPGPGHRVAALRLRRGRSESSL
jgi:hypothetical protein